MIVFSGISVDIEELPSDSASDSLVFVACDIRTRDSLAMESDCKLDRTGISELLEDLEIPEEVVLSSNLPAIFFALGCNPSIFGFISPSQRSIISFCSSGNARIAPCCVTGVGVISGDFAFVAFPTPDVSVNFQYSSSTCLIFIFSAM
jgi:hypothetical protein